MTTRDIAVVFIIAGAFLFAIYSAKPQVITNIVKCPEQQIPDDNPMPDGMEL